MVEPRKKIVLTYPSRISQEDASALLDAFREADPRAYEEWLKIERDITNHPGDSLKDVSASVWKFLLANCDFSSTLAISVAFDSMRIELVNQLRHEKGLPRWEI